MNYNPNTISELVKIGMSGPEGRQLLQQYYSNPPEWMTPSEARLFVPIAAERLDRLKEASDKIIAPETTVAEDKVAGLAGLAPQGEGMPMPEEEQAMPEEEQAMPEEGAEQGVASLPVPEDMYQEETMAAGGIVAFDDGGAVQRFQTGGTPLITSMADPRMQEILAAYNAAPEGSIEKAQLKMLVDQMDSKLAGIPTALPTAQTTPPPAYTGQTLPSPTEGQDEAMSRISELQKGLPALVARAEVPQTELDELRNRRIKERRDIYTPIDNEVKSELDKREKRINDRFKDAGLWAAFRGFATLASTPGSFAVGAGKGANAFAEAYESAAEKEEAARSALSSMNMNFKMSQASRRIGDLEAADTYERAYKDDRRQAVNTQINAVKAQGDLIGEAAKVARGITEERLKFFQAVTDRIKVNQGDRFDRIFNIFKADPNSKGLSDARIAIAAGMVLDPGSFSGGRAGTNLAQAGTAVENELMYGPTPAATNYRAAMAAASAPGADTKPYMKGGKPVMDPSTGKPMTVQQYNLAEAEKLKQQIVTEKRSVFGVNEVQSGGALAGQIFAPWMGSSGVGGEAASNAEPPFIYVPGQGTIPNPKARVK